MSKELNAVRGIWNGKPAIFVDGKPLVFSSFKLNENSKLSATLESIPLEIPGISEEGIRVCWIPVFIDWKGPDDYDFSDMDTRINAVMREYDAHPDPEGRTPVFVLRIQAAVFSPPWYIRQSEENGKYTNLIEFKNVWGDAEVEPFTLEMRYMTRHPHYSSTFAISPGDPFWDTHALDCLSAILEHAKKQPYHERMFGVLPCAFTTNEWFLFSDSPSSCCDFSKPMQKAFRNYLIGKGIDAGENPVPAPRTCFQPGGFFLDSQKMSDRIQEEFSLYLNGRMAEIIEQFARRIKSFYVEHPKLVGFFYGYTNELSCIHNLAQSGHLAVGRLLRSPDIDFFCSPCQYRYRGDDKPFTYNQVLGVWADSAALYGKLAFAEDDHPPAWASRTEVRDDWHDEMFLRRNFASAATHGQHQWWYSLGCQWYREPKRRAKIGQLNRIAETMMTLDRSTVSEVAVVVDERSVSAMRLNPNLQRNILLDSFASVFSSGTPFDFFELHSFLELADTKQYKFVLFLNLFLMDSEIERGLEKWKGGGRTLMFQMFPGYLSDDSGQRVFSEERSSSVTGIKLKKTEPQAMIVWIDPDRVSFPDDVRYGDRQFLHSLLSVSDSAAESLGFLYDGSVGLARKKQTDWTSIFSAAPCMPGNVLRALFRNAGIHCYAETGDVAYVNASVAAYSSSSNGQKTLTMPGPETLCDVMTGETFQTDASHSISFQMRRHEVRIFFRIRKLD